MKKVVARHAAVFALYLLLAVVATWPVVTRLGSVLPGEKSLVNWYLYRMLLERPLWHWFDTTFDQLNYPDGGTAIVVALPQFLLARVLSVAVSPTVALNVSLLLHLALGGYAGWRLSRRVWDRLPGGEWPHLAAGAALGISSFALGVWANGQPENLGVGYVALAAEAAWALGHGAGMGAIVGLVAAIELAFLSSPYMVMGFLLAAAPFLLAARARRRSVALATVVVMLVVGAFSAHFARTLPTAGSRVLCPTMLELTPAEATRIDLSDLAKIRTNPDENAETLVMDPVWTFQPPRLPSGKSHERLLGYFGWSGLVLAGIGLYAARGGRRWLLAAMAGPAILAMGPTFGLNGWTPTWHGYLFRLPLYYLFHLPVLGHMFSTINVPVRMVVGLLLPLSLAIARGAAELPAAARPVAIVALVADQLLRGPSRPPQSPWPLHEFGAYGALAREADHAGVFDTPPVGALEHPPPVSFTRTLIADAWRHHHPTPYAGCYPPLYNERLESTRFAALVREAAAGGVTPELAPVAQEVRDLGFRWWVVHTGTTYQTADGDAHIVAAARAAFREVNAAADGTYLFDLDAR